MIKCILALCSQYALLDKQSGALSAISILEDLTVPILPGMIGTLSAVFILRRDSDDDSRQQVLVIAGMMNSQRQSFPFVVDFQDRLTTRGIATLQGVPIPTPGVFRLDIASASGQVLATWEMNISTVISQPVVSTSPVETTPQVNFAEDSN